MPIKIKSTSGSVTLDAQNVSGDQTLTVPSQASATLQTTADAIVSTRLTGTIADARFPATLVLLSHHYHLQVLHQSQKQWFMQMQ